MPERKRSTAPSAKGKIVSSKAVSKHRGARLGLKRLEVGILLVGGSTAFAEGRGYIRLDGGGKSDVLREEGEVVRGGRWCGKAAYSQGST